MLCFSHTHAAPNESAEPDYYQFVCRQVLEAAKQAWAERKPVNAVWGNGCCDVGVNRRYGCETMDRRVGILKVCDAGTGELALLLLRVTAHGNVLKADNRRISLDWFGNVRAALGTELGCPVMVTQGAAGNAAPRYFDSALTPYDAADERFIRSDRALEIMGQKVLQAVVPVVRALTAENTDVGMESRYLTLSSPVPEMERAQALAREAYEACGIDGSAWLQEVKRLQEAGIRQQEETVEVQYFRLGKGCLCGVANEIMCEFALRAQQMLADEYFYLGGYTNGCTGYFPTEEEYDRGGYEVYWSWLTYYIYHGRVYPFPREAAAELIRFTVQNKPTGGKTMFREMRRTLQVLPQEECEKLLQSGTAGVLALTGDDGYPYAVPLSYAYAEGKLYFHCARTGHKIDAIRRSEKASFCVIGQDQIVPEELTTYYRSVIAFGRIRIVEEEKEKRRILGALADKYAPTLSEEKRQAGIEQDLAPVCILEMQVEHLSGKEGKKLAAERQRGRSQA